jgi:hypothetical protein
VVIFDVVAEVIFINEVIAGVVGWVDVDKFDLARVGLLEELENFEVVAFDHQVLGGVPVNAVLRAGAERAVGRAEGDLAGLALAEPVEAVLLLGVGHRLVADELLEDIEVDAGAAGAFGDQLREELLEAG